MNPTILPVNKTPSENFDFPAPHSGKQQEADGVDLAAMVAIMVNSGLQKLTANYVEENIPYSIAPLNPPA